MRVAAPRMRVQLINAAIPPPISLYIYLHDMYIQIYRYRYICNVYLH